MKYRHQNCLDNKYVAAAASLECKKKYFVPWSKGINNIQYLHKDQANRTVEPDFEMCKYVYVK
jgi:hypothetical protein